MTDKLEDPLAEAWEALDAGRPAEALSLAAASGQQDLARTLVEGHAFLDLGHLKAGEGALERARDAAVDADDRLDVLELEGELCLRAWRLDRAREVFEELAASGFDPAWWDRRALLADLAGQPESADRLLAEAVARAPESAAPPTRLAAADFDRVVEEAVASLPDVFRSAVERARLVREQMPFEALVLPDDPAATPPDLLGLFVGPTLHELAEERSGELPPCIYLFQRNLERATRGVDELREEIRVTLFHEIGHLLGLDEDEVAAMGLA